LPTIFLIAQRAKPVGYKIGLRAVQSSGKDDGMKRWLGRGVICALLICCAVVATCWITSYIREDRAFMSRDGRCVQIVSHRGRLSFFTLAEYPTPLPWTWEHDEGPIERPGRPPQVRGVGRTLEIVLRPRHEDWWGPVAISDGLADTDPTAQKVWTVRIKSAPQYVPPQKYHTAQRAAATLPKTSDETIDQVVKSARALEKPRELHLAPAGFKIQKPPAGGERLDLGSNDTFSLGITPTSKSDPAGTPRSSDFGLLSAARTGLTVVSALPLGAMVQMWPSYFYDAVELPYYLFFLVPFASLLALGALKLRRRQVRQSRRRDGRCLACGYDLHGTRAEKCPECGAQTLTALKPAPTH
jgi:hypothetical protein